MVIGPMNGGMEFPAGFARLDGRLTEPYIATARWTSAMLNLLLPGKLRAKILLVANKRTHLALPQRVSGVVMTLIENGVDLSLWSPPQGKPAGGPVRFIFIGRLVDWKCVDLLLEAFA